MPDSTNTQLAPFIERARKVLQYEQRGNHQDRVVKGGLELFVVRWADEVSAVCKKAGMDLKPVYRFTEHLEGYRRQDPMQRAANLRMALSILNELEHNGEGNNTGSPSRAGNPGKVSPDASGSSSIRGELEEVKREFGEEKWEEPPSGRPPAPTRLANAAEQRNYGSGKTQGEGSPLQKPVSPEREPIRLEAGMSSGHASLTLLSAEITAIPGVGPSVAAKLHSLGIRTIRDLLFYFPRQHRDYSKLEKIAAIPFGEVTTTLGLIWEVETVRTSKGLARTIATISDETGKLRVSWFNQPYLQKQLQAAKGSYLVVTGVKQRFGNKIEFSVRSHELPEQGDLLNTGRLVPTYSLTEGLNAKSLRRFTKWVVDRYATMIPEYLPVSVRSAGKLMPLPEAVSQIHYPENEQALQAARLRLSFDELFLIQLGMQERRSRWQREAPLGNAFNIDFNKILIDTGGLTEVSGVETAQGVDTQRSPTLPGNTLWSIIATDKPFEETLQFRLTEAQRRVIIEIFGDLSQSKPMCRLLQGNVGAGKTAVAAAALLMAALNGYQGAIMAPTELLAEQHAQSIGAMLEPFGIRTVLLTGGLRPRERTMGRSAIENGEAMVAIGTHALIQEDVHFARLGLVIVDEQHRFGVEQRDILRQKGYHPHMLVMTATPIPRTLALTVYGDLDVSVIDQMPPGRQKIISRWRSGARRDEANRLISQQVSEGRQAFIICPLIEESESLAVKAATVEYERLSRDVFPHLRLGLLHGAMKSAEKDKVMRHFRDGELDIIVATSVIEVGIDVPNATVMVIEDADRFGLSQLHQFRGRVGRGKHQSYCYVLSADASLQAQERLEVFQATDDGFRLAEADLRLRGPGEFFGVRQSGVPELRVADLTDTRLVELTRTLASKLWESDPYLRKPEHAALRERMHLFWQSFMAH